MNFFEIGGEIVERKRKMDEQYMNIQQLMAYTTLGRNRAMQLGKESGACIKFGRRVFYSKQILDQYLENLLMS